LGCELPQGPITLARFFQIDQKLDATVDLALATQIPLIH
jgi:hypothetical protein